MLCVCRQGGRTIAKESRNREPVDLPFQKLGPDEARALLAAIVDSSDDAIVSKTLESRILSWNAGAERLFGYAAHEAIGLPITIIIPEERQDEERIILEKISRGERIEHFETQRVTKQGRVLDVSLTISPVRDSQGRIVAVSKIARDITASKRSEEALRSVKDALAAQLADLQRLHEMSVRLSATPELQPILDETLRTASALDGADRGLLLLVDPETGRLCVSASLGLSEEFLQQIESLHPENAPCGRCLREGRRVIVKDVENDPDFAPYRDIARVGRFRAIHNTPLLTRSGKAVGVLTTYFCEPHEPSDRQTRLVDLCTRQAVDFIENAQLYNQLLEADQRKDEFLATLAHELRNPLAPLSNALQILRVSDGLTPAIERLREIMDRQVQHMVRLVDDLMDVSRIARGRIELRLETVDLAAIVRSAVETSRPLINAAGHALSVSFPDEPILVTADPVRLAQVIGNLLTNSAKYTEDQGRIGLSVRLEGNDAVVSVRDSGLGISAEMLPHVFEMFSQVDRTVHRAQGGLGIGLTLAKRLVEMQGGAIEARSEGLGKGSEFVIRLPSVRGAVPSTAAPLVSRDARRPLPSRRILVVDDARAAVFTLSTLLERLGQEVYTAQSAASALEVVREKRPDVVISDIAMPNMNGHELARLLRREPESKGLVLVALTGFGQDADKQHTLEAGFDFHLVKPVGLNALEDLLGSLTAPLEPVS
ncbi:MAG TPA: PAS domain S-box protein [Planctomycetaceae bacterium]|nr:PAS domain S-box protein [Planctomycetaceae bacterium]